MLTLPRKYDTLIAAFAPIFGKRIWPQVLGLVVGAVLAPGKRTVTSVLRIMGMGDEEHFQNYHRLGVETQRQWSDLAIARTTPALLGLFSLVTLLADQSVTRRKLPIRQAAWYSKQLPTFSDALALVRDQSWQAMTFHTSLSEADMAKVPRTLPKGFTEALCYAA